MLERRFPDFSSMAQTRKTWIRPFDSIEKSRTTNVTPELTVPTESKDYSRNNTRGRTTQMSAGIESLHSHLLFLGNNQNRRVKPMRVMPRKDDYYVQKLDVLL